MIEVLHSGFYTSIQDLGRTGVQKYGVPYSGVMDKRAAMLANALLGNNINEAVLEITLMGPKLQFNGETALVISGGDMSPKLNGNPVQNNHFISVNQGDILSFGPLKTGCRSYLAVSGGIHSENIMASKSMYQGITKAISLKKGDVVKVSKQVFQRKKHFAHLRFDDTYITSEVLDVFKGPEFDLLSPEQQQKLQNDMFSISNANNRMAYQLNEHIKNDIEPIITSSVLPGTVQLTPSGKLIVLMRDCQTTGGYPRVLQLKDSAIDVLAQKKTGDSLLFKLITL
ncbi:biotin-dependent carboxyltransferase family protein [Tamlana fucoidanivorans]|uniref:Biotin-dependent carboxyltransferase family protein n=1 Tax=Allotamlana fucoidanivorans TaxID=2583814 RepID=A0A5C4SH34_9FLAO|nr:biotin-dependent carboxyltransferase family protein [Tamlana fucoidanivorans]TNJ42967.1 biotin-dependent carboxyltransferase family protein [Tamlana fucoidanivorans]